MSYAIILRGLKFPTSIFDEYLASNRVEQTYGQPLLSQSNNEITSFLRSQTGSTASTSTVIDHSNDASDVSVFVPHQRGFNDSTFVYIAYSWMKVFAHREIVHDELVEAVPPGFELWRQELLAFAAQSSECSDPALKDAKIGLYVVVVAKKDMGYVPSEVYDRGKVPVPCDFCDQSFNSFDERQHHRRNVHGSKEGSNPLPNA